MFSETPKIPSKNTSIFGCILAPFWFPKLSNFGIIFYLISIKSFNSFFNRYLLPSRSLLGSIFHVFLLIVGIVFRLMISPIFECNVGSILIVFRIPPNPHFAALAEAPCQFSSFQHVAEMQEFTKKCIQNCIKKAIEILFKFTRKKHFENESNF